MNARHERFCREYVVDLSPSKAAGRVGYSGKHGFRLLLKDSIKRRVAELQAERAQRLAITADRVLEEMANMAFANMEDYVGLTPDGDAVIDFSHMDRAKWAAVQEVTVDEYTSGRGTAARQVKRTRFKLHDKEGPLLKVGKHLGMWPARPAERIADNLEALILKSYETPAEEESGEEEET
jgi:phage terminase small subunit